MRSESRRSQLDHDRYMHERECRLEKQRRYYREHRDKYLANARKRYLK